MDLGRGGRLRTIVTGESFDWPNRKRRGHYILTTMFNGRRHVQQIPVCFEIARAMDEQWLCSFVVSNSPVKKSMSHLFTASPGAWRVLHKWIVRYVMPPTHNISHQVPSMIPHRHRHPRLHPQAPYAEHQRSAVRLLLQSPSKKAVPAGSQWYAHCHRLST